MAIPSPTPSSVTRTLTRSEDGGVHHGDPRTAPALRAARPPQAFKLSTIRRAYEVAAGDPNFQHGRLLGRAQVPADVPIHVVAGDEYNMKVTQPVDVFIRRQALPARLHRRSRAGLRVGLPQLPPARPWWSSAVVRHRQDIAELAESYGATVYALGAHPPPATTWRTEEVDDALSKAYGETGRIDYVVNTAGVLRIGKLAETDNATIERR
ncbi:hypothetical protein GCM10023238_28450 [Streptomyces heliomycini]